MSNWLLVNVLFNCLWSWTVKCVLLWSARSTPPAQRWQDGGSTTFELRDVNTHSCDKHIQESNSDDEDSPAVFSNTESELVCWLYCIFVYNLSRRVVFDRLLSTLLAFTIPNHCPSSCGAIEWCRSDLWLDCFHAVPQNKAEGINCDNDDHQKHWISS